MTATLQNGITAAASNFWRWWRDELVQLLPMTVRSRLQHRRLLPVVVTSETQWELWTPSLANNRAARVKQTVLDMTTEPDDRVREAIARLASPVALLMPAAMVLRRTLTLPLALEENLKQALTYDLDRHTPFPADELYFDAQVISRNPDRSEMQVVLAATQRANADRIMKELREEGAEVVALLVDPPENVSSRLNLLPTEDRPSWLPWQRWAIAGGVALLVVLLLAAIALPIIQKRAYAIKLHEKADATQAQAMAVTRVHDELDQLVADYDFVPEKKGLYPSTVHVLDEITKLLPDDTWLTQMEIKNTTGNKEVRHEVFLRGESAHASRLVTLLEDSGLVAQAAPRSPITSIKTSSGGTAEMFDIGAQIKKSPEREKEAVMIEGKIPPPAPPPRPITPLTPATPAVPGAALPPAAATDVAPAAPGAVPTPAAPGAAPAAPAARGGFGPFAPAPAAKPDAAPAVHPTPAAHPTAPAAAAPKGVAPAQPPAPEGEGGEGDEGEHEQQPAEGGE